MRFLRTIVFSVLAVGGATAAQAETVCAQHDMLVKFLDTKYGEQQTGYGLAGARAMMEVYVSEKHTFTIISTTPSGLSCIVAAGDNWESFEPKKKLTAM